MLYERGSNEYKGNSKRFNASYGERNSKLWGTQLKVNTTQSERNSKWTQLKVNATQRERNSTWT